MSAPPADVAAHQPTPASGPAPASGSAAQLVPAAALTRSGPARRALPTLNSDGSRYVLRPRLSPGRFLRRRRIVGYTLIALFVVLPHLRIGGRPPLLLDLAHRELSLMGAVFRPSEGVLLMLLGLATVLTVFFVTALWGRVWCGYACPQSVYLELVFRPLERWIEGPSRQGRGFSWRRLLKWIAYAALAFALANVFLSYFVPTDQLWRWISSSPAVHPAGFAVVAAVSALMFFDFAYFREQTCTVACPYGRLQSVLLDRGTMVVGYDARRGEPRGKPGKSKPLDERGGSAAPTGSCIDCRACVATCPTGIDIRDGLQMECIGCAQCIDACDAIMDRVHQPRGLIRYVSQDELGGATPRRLRARVVAYPALLALVVGILAVLLVERGDTELWVLRNEGLTFQELGDGRVSSLVRIKIENRGGSPRAYQLALVGADGAELIASQPRLEVAAGSAQIATAFVVADARSFHNGQRTAAIQVTEDGRPLAQLTVTLLGPDRGATGAAGAATTSPATPAAPAAPSPPPPPPAAPDRASPQEPAP